VKKKICIGIVIVMILVLLYITYWVYVIFIIVRPGPGPELPSESVSKEEIKNIRKKYPEWMGALDIQDEKIVKIKCDSNRIELNIDDQDGDYLKKLVQKDHDFIKKHPDRFDKKVERSLYYEDNNDRNGKKSYGYRNYFNPFCGWMEAYIKLDGSMKIGFVWGNNNLGNLIIDNVEVLEIYRNGKYGNSNDCEYKGVNSKFLLENKINDLKYIIIFGFEEGADKELEDKIKDNYPNVKVYQVKTKNIEQ